MPELAHAGVSINYNSLTEMLRYCYLDSEDIAVFDAKLQMCCVWRANVRALPRLLKAAARLAR